MAKLTPGRPKVGVFVIASAGLLVVIYRTVSKGGRDARRVRRARAT